MLYFKIVQYCNKEVYAWKHNIMMCCACSMWTCTFTRQNVISASTIRTIRGYLHFMHIVSTTTATTVCVSRIVHLASYWYKYYCTCYVYTKARRQGMCMWMYVYPLIDLIPKLSFRLTVLVQQSKIWISYNESLELGMNESKKSKKIKICIHIGGWWSVRSRVFSIKRNDTNWSK